MSTCRHLVCPAGRTMTGKLVTSVKTLITDRPGFGRWRLRAVLTPDAATAPVPGLRRPVTTRTWPATIAGLLCLLAVSTGVVASAQAHTPDERRRVLEVFVRDDCPHCADAKAFLTGLAREDPALAIVYREVDRDPSARAELVRVFDRAGMWPPGVPTFVADGEMLVGFADADTTGPAVRALVARTLPPSPTVDSALFGTLSASRLGLPLFTLALGLLDGFNPCAMWVLLFLLSLLVRLHDRRRMALIAGTFVLVSGAVYYAFMAAWLNVFLAVGMSTAIRWTLGLVAIGIGAVNVKDFAAWGWGPSLSIPASAKSGLYARARAVINADALAGSLVAVATLAVLVNVVELLCTAGLPAIYTAVLTQHNLSHAAHYAYLGLYIVGYVADDTVMVVAAVTALGSHKLTERAGRWLKLLSGLVMLALGTVLLLRPAWIF